jgi:hypothetical protein
MKKQKQQHSEGADRPEPQHNKQQAKQTAATEKTQDSSSSTKD